jgi:hypothetical protein
MENKLIEDELIYEEINGVKGLKYKLQNSNTKVSEDPKIKKWISSEKVSKGDNGIACYCTNCTVNYNILEYLTKKSIFIFCSYSISYSLNILNFI